MYSENVDASDKATQKRQRMYMTRAKLLSLSPYCIVTVSLLRSEKRGRIDRMTYDSISFTESRRSNNVHNLQYLRFRRARLISRSASTKFWCAFVESTGTFVDQGEQ
ncbi:hypothetical protein SISSUDRAFT_752358 [Sistotremastrum suecicum HHB10207 ss-3]|uniref:Uncharacterized protein n=1 Tax=Sistotremastrum suecicum HHB10207 ss-3 TaxID=1314776 RepID=A0A166DEA5_9AGAM|nr:hypothetical protein SISSUDRAFT_752358 [Sistotremastrum suecicum HHB10207 ss-3]